MSAKMEKRRLGLALGGGGARGLAHIGVLEVLEREGITIDMIAGTSIGAIIGALYARGKSADQIRRLALDMGWRRLAPLLDLALPKTGFFAGRRLREQLRSVIGDAGFGELKIPLACVATDIMTGDEVVLSEGPVLEGVLASISLPVIFKVTKWRDRYLVDGGLVNPVPVSPLKKMGADSIIAVNVIPNPGEKRGPPEKSTRVKEPNIFHIIMQLINIPAHQIVKSSLSGADVIIEPRMEGIGFGDFGHARECIRRGQLAAQESIPEIKRLLAN